MCNIIREYSKDVEVVTGYKVAIRYKNKYLSPSTGIEYKVGEVPKLNRSDNDKRFIHTHWKNPLEKYSTFFDKRHRGSTQLFEELYHARRFLQATFIKGCVTEDIGLVILKIKGVPTYKAILGFNAYNASTVLVNKILKIDKVE